MQGTISVQSPLIRIKCSTKSGCIPSTVSSKTERVCATVTFVASAIKTFPVMFVFIVTSERRGDNITLTCALTCSRECEKDFNLSWSGCSQNSWQSGLMSENNTLVKRLFLPVSSMTSEEITCLVRREGEVMASKRWHTVNRK